MPSRILRGRLTVGSDALNIEMLVRFQPPQLLDPYAIRYADRLDHVITAALNEP